MSPRRWRAVLGVALLAGCSAPATATPAERAALDAALDREWDSDPHVYGCGAPSTDVTDRLAVVVQSVVKTDRLTAVLYAQEYRRERCPGR